MLADFTLRSFISSRRGRTLSVTDADPRSEEERKCKKAIKAAEARLRCQPRRRELEKEQVKDRGSAESDQYSNCKLNLTGARTSHQMGKEIGYER